MIILLATVWNQGTDCIQIDLFAFPHFFFSHYLTMSTVCRMILTGLLTSLTAQEIWECSSDHDINADCDGWAMIWNDEFDDNSTLFRNWNYDLGDGSKATSSCISSCCPGDPGWGNGELQTFVNHTNAARIEDGNLLITAYGDFESGYKSARIASKLAFSYGAASENASIRIEARMFLPSAGSTVWPAFWMLPQVSDIPSSWPDALRCRWPYSGEIDVMEYQSTYWQVYNTMHFSRVPAGWWDSNHDFISKAFTIEMGQYHTFGVCA